jgi:hypothetical protein
MLMKYLTRILGITVLGILLSCGVWCAPRLYLRNDIPLTASAEQLKATIVTAHLEQPLEPGKNVLWCSTFQLAWNEICALIGEDVHLKTEPPLVAYLNKKAATKDDIDEDSYVALAGWVSEGILGKIQDALAGKFPNRPVPMPDIPQETRPQDIIAYAYLSKNLEFPVPFGRIDAPISFNGQKVGAFGIDKSQVASGSMFAQVSIIDYKTESDFIIELKTKSDRDRVFLAKITPDAALESTISAVNLRIHQATPSKMWWGDVLKIPRFNFDITREYSELYGSYISSQNPKVAPDSLILRAIQDIRFKLNEKGVRLESHSEIVFGCSAPLVTQHRMVFDRPFLLLLQKKDARVPYFALWVENAELMAASTK